MKQHSSANVLANGLALTVLLTLSAFPAAPNLVKIESKNMRVEFNAKLYSHVIAKFDGLSVPIACADQASL